MAFLLLPPARVACGRAIRRSTPARRMVACGAPPSARRMVRVTAERPRADCGSATGVRSQVASEAAGSAVELDPNAAGQRPKCSGSSRLRLICDRPQSLRSEQLLGCPQLSASGLRPKARNHPVVMHLAISPIGSPRDCACTDLPQIAPLPPRPHHQVRPEPSRDRERADC